MGEFFSNIFNKYFQKGHKSATVFDYREKVQKTTEWLRDKFLSGQGLEGNVIALFSRDLMSIRCHRFI